MGRMINKANIITNWMVNTRIRPSSSKILPEWLYPISACFLFVHCRMQYFILFFSFLPGIVYGRYGIINFYIWIYSYRYFKRLSKNQLRNGKKKSKKHNKKTSAIRIIAYKCILILLKTRWYISLQLFPDRLPKRQCICGARWWSHIWGWWYCKVWCKSINLSWYVQ